MAPHIRITRCWMFGSGNRVKSGRKSQETKVDKGWEWIVIGAVVCVGIIWRIWKIFAERKHTEKWKQAAN